MLEQSFPFQFMTKIIKSDLIKKNYHPNDVSFKNSMKHNQSTHNVEVNIVENGVAGACQFRIRVQLRQCSEDKNPRYPE